MKRLLTGIFIFAGIVFAQNAFAQTDTKAKIDSVKSSQKSGGTATPSPAPAPGGAGITIDESGAPRPKGKKNTSRTSNSTATPPPKEAVKDAAKEAAKGKVLDIIKGAAGNAEKQSPESLAPDAPDSPSEIAIDESGASRPAKAKPAAASTANPPSSDSTAIAPALEVIRPE